MAEQVKALVAALNEPPFEKNLTLISYVAGGGRPPLQRMNHECGHAYTETRDTHEHTHMHTRTHTSAGEERREEENSSESGEVTVDCSGAFLRVKGAKRRTAHNRQNTSLATAATASPCWRNRHRHRHRHRLCSFVFCSPHPPPPPLLCCRPAARCRFDALPPLQLLQVFNDILAEIAPDVRPLSWHRLSLGSLSSGQSAQPI